MTPQPHCCQGGQRGAGGSAGRRGPTGMGMGPAGGDCPCGTGAQGAGTGGAQPHGREHARGQGAGAPIPQPPPCPGGPQVPLGMGVSAGGMAPGQRAAHAHRTFTGGEARLRGPAALPCRGCPRGPGSTAGLRPGSFCPGQVPAKRGFGGCPSPGLWACGRPGHERPSPPAPSDLWRGKRAAQTDWAIKPGQEVARLQRPRGAAAASNNSGAGEHRAAAPMP